MKKLLLACLLIFTISMGGQTPSPLLDEPTLLSDKGLQPLPILKEQRGLYV